MIEYFLKKLQKSKFRSSFKLDKKEIELLNKKSLGKIRQDVIDILKKNIRERQKNDGKQTPYKGHVCFIAQHATATCCRKCLEKWYKIPKNKVLSNQEVWFFTDIIMTWIKSQSSQKTTDF